jgi:DNA-binding sugar fermentation-stimulating protein
MGILSIVGSRRASSLILLATMAVTRSGKGSLRVVSALAATRGTSSVPPKQAAHGKPKRSRSDKVVKQKATLKRAVDQNEAISAIETTTITTTITRTKLTPPTKPFEDLLMSLPDDVVMGEIRCRPSKRNRSPYVGDVWLPSEGREAICHLPNLDMGGKCVAGVKILMKPARDKKGNLVGKDAVNPKFGTPKCEFIAQLLWVDESELGYEPAWVGAHPTLGEKLTEELVRRNLLGPAFPKTASFQREVRNVGGTDMRADFLIQHEDPKLKPRILEVKTVVDTDYAVDAIPIDRTKCVFTSDVVPYKRTGIFPWGEGKQKGPDGEPVVSARAIKHVRELTRIVQDDTKRFDATVLFIVIRHDAKAFRPNIDACPSFARYLKEARDAGVQILAKQVVWGEEGENIGKCYEGDLLDIDWPC